MVLCLVRGSFSLLSGSRVSWVFWGWWTGGGGDGVLTGVGAQEGGGVCFIFAGVPMYGGAHEKQ